MTKDITKKKKSLKPRKHIKTKLGRRPRVQTQATQRRLEGAFGFG